jgi:cell division septum initiation protein DivIVA
MSIDTARDALLDDARRQAEDIVEAGERDARERLGAAQADADALVARARAEGEAAGRVDAARVLAAQRFAANLQVLGARRASYDVLRAQARDAALALRAEPGYADLLERLAAAARRELGPGADLTIDPAGRGGVVARAGSREIDFTLVVLAERCVERLGSKAAALWA